MHFSLSIAQNMTEKFESVSFKTILNEMTTFIFDKKGEDIISDYNSNGNEDV